jgi:predicted AlkP superfamily phosphohydrolase/phosphomutase
MRTLTLVFTGMVLSACGGESQAPQGPEASAPETPAPVDRDRVVVIGFDGVDPDHVENWKDELPHLAAHMAAGRMRRLGTTTPPQSPVAWATFATSLNPGSHGIFDFIGRDPTTYFPEVGTNSYKAPGFDSAGKVQSPGSGSSPRSGESFWKTAADAGIRTTVLSVPYSFPADDLGPHGKILSGLGTPDLRLTNSTFFLFGTDVDAEADKKNVSGGDLVPLKGEAGSWTGVVEGPRKVGGRGRVAATLKFETKPGSGVVSISGDGLEVEGRVGELSSWATVSFDVSNFYIAKALVRFLPLQVEDGLRVYMTPLMIHPDAPYLPISHPAEFAADLSKTYGSFKTIGWVHDTSALNSEQISDDAFAADMKSVFDARLAMTLGELKKDEADLLVSVFTATDRAGHLFTRFLDPAHSRHETDASQADLILQTYRWMDDALGQIEDSLGEADRLIVLSDHGFHTFRRGFAANTWLFQNGFLALNGGVEPGKKTSLIRGHLDWSKTRAYAMGTGQIYINLAGREKNGVVAQADYAATCQEIVEGLKKVVDPSTGEPVLVDVFTRETWSGERLDHRAPDLQLAFADGVQLDRGGSALGGVPAEMFSDNTQKWSGDHAASDPADTEGFLLSNLDGLRAEAAIADIAPTVLGLLGVEVPLRYEGRDLRE